MNMMIKNKFLRGTFVLLISAFMSIQGLASERKVFRIGVTKIVAHAALDADEKGFEAGLASAGFKEGVNVIYDRQNAQGDLGKAQAIAEKLVEQKPAAILQQIDATVRNMLPLDNRTVASIDASFCHYATETGRLTFAGA